MIYLCVYLVIGVTLAEVFAIAVKRIEGKLEIPEYLIVLFLWPILILMGISKKLRGKRLR